MTTSHPSDWKDCQATSFLSNEDDPSHSDGLVNDLHKRTGRETAASPPDYDDLKATNAANMGQLNGCVDEPSNLNDVQAAISFGNVEAPCHLNSFLNASSKHKGKKTASSAANIIQQSCAEDEPSNTDDFLTASYSINSD